MTLASQAREDLGHQQDAYTYSALVATAGSAGNRNAVLEAFHDACRRGACTVAVCNAAIEALSKCGDFQVRCFELHTFSCEGDLHKDGTADCMLNFVSRACYMSCMQEALSLYEERMPSQGVIPDTITFNALIRAVGRSRRPDLAGQAAHYFTTLSELGLHPDKYTFSAFFNAAHHCKLSDGGFLLHVRANEPAMPPCIS